MPVMTTREIVDTLLSGEKSKPHGDTGYIRALEDVVFYDEQHERNRNLPNHAAYTDAVYHPETSSPPGPRTDEEDST